MGDGGRLGRVRALFARARGLGGAERAALLSHECGDDHELREEVEALLARDGAWAALEPDAVGGGAAGVLGAMEALAAPGERIGAYRVEGVLGEGGMGVVYLAEQTEPIRRDVALKVIKLGMDTRRVVSRFRHERQALALMSHPGIARVYEAGSTPSGRPYFAMEYVDGRAITAYCDEERLPVRDRLRLFVRLCHAVQHAHQKGVVHRDLKPSNVLVVDEGGVSVPKIIDFGIAKAIGAADRERTVQTRAGHVVGTPGYMAPEQLDPALGESDTRTDVYALGVLLFELLTGEVPFPERSRGIAVAPGDARTPRPSTVLRERVSDPDRVAELRRATPASLRQALRGGLDWIVLKALSESAGGRYATADMLAIEVEAYLGDRAIVACPPSRVASARLFVRRNRVLVAAGAVVALAITGGLVAAVYGLREARVERDLAQFEASSSEQVSAFLTGMLGSADPDAAGGRNVPVSELLDDAVWRLEHGDLAERPLIRARLRRVIGDCYAALGRYDPAIEQLSAALATTEHELGVFDVTVGDLLDALGGVQTSAGRYGDAERNHLRAIEIRRANGAPSPLAGRSGNLGSVYHWTGRFEEAERYFRDALAELEREGVVDDPRVVSMQGWLGVELEIRGKMGASLEAHRAAVDAARVVYGGSHTGLAGVLNNLANAYEAAGDYESARRAHEESLSIKRALLRPGHPEIATSLNNLALVHIREGEPGVADPMLREAAEIRNATLGEDHPSTAVAYSNLGLALRDLGRPGEAIVELDRAISIASAALGEDHLMPTAFRISRATCLMRIGRFDEAERILVRERTNLNRLLPPDHRRLRELEDHLRVLNEFRSGSQRTRDDDAATGQGRDRSVDD